MKECENKTWGKEGVIRQARLCPRFRDGVETETDEMRAPCRDKSVRS